MPDVTPLIEAVLATINAPRPRHMDPDTFLACLFADVPLAGWRPHMRALFDEGSGEAIHRLVLAGIATFGDLDRAARVWGVGESDNRAWIKEKAALRLAGAVARDDRADERPDARS